MRIAIKQAVILFLVIFSIKTWAQSQTINIYTYHLDPPYKLDHQASDLSRIFVDKLNQWQKKVIFNLVEIRRPELNQLIVNDHPYLILWANPIWFKSKDQNVMATKNIFWDADIWISSNFHPINYSEPDDLLGKTIGGREGYFYKGVTPLIKQNKITAQLSLNDYDNYKKLLRRDIDVFVMSRSSYLYWGATGLHTKDLNVALSPHDAFERKLLLSDHYVEMKPLLDEFIELLKQDKHWLHTLKTWGIDKLINPIELELEELKIY